MNRILQSLYCLWFIRRHGVVRVVRPPLGWHRVYSPKPWWWFAAYRVRWARYRLRCWLFNRYGGPVRARWAAEFFGRREDGYRPMSPRFEGNP